MASAACATCEIHAESTFKVEGMDCREEVALIERRFKHLVGVEDFTADVIGLLHHAGAQQAIVAGHDWGGVIAWNLAMRHPQVVTFDVRIVEPHHLDPHAIE